MNFKRMSKVMSMAMLFASVGQITYPLASKSTNLIAAEIDSMTPDVVYTKEDFLANKNGNMYQGTIVPTQDKELSYNIVFNEFVSSSATARVNGNTIKITPEVYSGQTISGTTSLKIDYAVDAGDINEDILNSLVIKEKQFISKDTGDITVDEEEVVDAQEQEDTTDAETTIGTPADSFEDNEISKNDGTDQETPLEYKTSSSEANKGAIAANDAIAVWTHEGFDLCRQTPDAYPNGSSDYDTDPADDTIGAYPQYFCNYSGKTGIIGAPTEKPELFELMNVQARDGEGKSVDITADMLKDDAGWEDYKTDLNQMDANKIVDAGDVALDSSAEISPFYDSAGEVHPYVSYDFTFTYEDQSATSTLTLVNPFYYTSKYEANKFGKTVTTSVPSLFEEHYFGNLWQGLSSVGNYMEEPIKLFAGFTLDMVLDIQYDKTEDTVDTDSIINEDDIKALTPEGEQTYVLSQGDQEGQTIDEVNQIPDDISGYQLEIPRGSYNEKDLVMNNDFLAQYFNKFEVTTGQGADNELDTDDDPSTLSINEGTNEINGYAARQYDDNTDTQSYSTKSYCMKETLTENLHYDSSGNTYTYTLVTGITDDSDCSTNTYTGHTMTDDIPSTTNLFKLPVGSCGPLGSTYPCNNSGSRTTTFWSSTGDTAGVENPMSTGEGCEAVDVIPGDVGDGTCSASSYVSPTPNGDQPFYGYRKTNKDVDGYHNTGTVDDPEIEDVQNENSTLVTDGLETMVNAEISPADIKIVDDGGYDNDITGVYNVVLGYHVAKPEANTNLKFPDNNGGYTGIEDIGDRGQDVYMILPVDVYEPVRIAADDTEIWEYAAPKSVEGLKSLMDVEAYQLQEITRDGAKDYQDKEENNSDVCVDASSSASVLPGAIICNDEDKMYFNNNKYDAVQVHNWSGYDFDDPEVGEYYFTFFVDRFGGVRGELDDKDYFRDVTLYVKDNGDTIHNADLDGTTPITINSGPEEVISWTDIIEQLKLVQIFTENGQKIGARQDITVDDVLILEDGGYNYQNNAASTVVIETRYKGLGIQGVFEIDSSGNGVPWEMSDQISMEALNPITILKGSEWDPITTTNAHAYNKDLEEQNIEVDMDIVMPNVEKTDAPYQVGLIGYKQLAGSYYARSYILIDVYVADVDEYNQTKLATTDAKSRGAFSAENSEQLKEMMDVEAIGADGEDITDLVEVFSTGGFEYGDSKTVGEPYEITFGVTDPATGVTYTDTADYSILINKEHLPDVTLKATDPIYVKLGDDIGEDELLNLFASSIELNRDYEFYGLDNDDINIVNAGGFDANQEDTYYVELGGVYNEPKSEIDPMKAEGIFEVVVDEDVETTQAPVSFTGVDSINLAVGSTFDPLAGVSATSMTDGDITSDIEILKNDVDTSKDGNYSVTYYVEDSTSAYAEVTREVIVGEGDDTVSDKFDDNLDAGDSSVDSDSKLTQVTKEDESSIQTLTNTSKTNVFVVISLMILLMGSYVLVDKKYNK